MSKITQLSPEWYAWIAENAARGCTPQSMIDAMVRANVDPVCARAAVDARDDRDDPPPHVPPADYMYETPRLPAGNRIHAGDRDVQVLLRMARPTVAVLGNVLSADECDELIARSRTRLRRSTTVDPERGTFEVITARSSEGTFFPVNADPFIARLDRRIAALMNCPVDHGEGLQILHYKEGGEYRPHWDYFPPDNAGSAVQMATGGQRVSSLVMYLNDVSCGGATAFPQLGLEVCPAKGAAVYFEYANSRGQIDPMTLHAGMPVREGEKWIATKWMRQRRYGEMQAVPSSAVSAPER